MQTITRRQFARRQFITLQAGTVGLSLGAVGLSMAAPSLRAADRIRPILDDVLTTGIQRRKLPGVVAMVGTADRVVYQGAFGNKEVSSVPVAVDSIFSIASMTKPITSVAAMQLVEQGKLTLDEPVARFIPEFATFPVLDGFDPVTGKAKLHRVRTPITLRHLLTHTAGFAYSLWSPKMAQLEAHGGHSETTLLFEPGTAWQYGYSVDWTGRLIEKISGLTLEQYFNRNVTGPLGMNDTGFQIPPEKFDRMTSLFRRSAHGNLQADARRLPGPPKSFSGGGGLYGTAPDYVRFLQMILRRGRLNVQNALLNPATIDLMASNQIGDLSAGKLKSIHPEISSDADFHPGFVDRYGLGFLINTKAHEGGRSAGSLAWAGIDNTFFWIDPQRGICAVLMLQFLPFCDREAMGLLGDFERALYANS